MMKSIFLSDSRVLDLDGSPMNSNNNSSSKISDEYIIVDPAPSFDSNADSSSVSNSELHDEEEYDYCDDAISEGMQYEPFNLTEEMIMEEAEQPSIQHILDEAHKSASQLVQASEMPDILESSASDVSVQFSSKEQEKDQPVDTNETHETEPEEKPRPAASTPTPTSDQPLPQVGGRMSNKKRRKKMKLLKKAAAAAKAAANLSSDVPQSANNTRCSSSVKSKKLTKRMPVTRYQNKRVANVAVACATETLACYKAEVMAASKKVH